MLKKILSFDKHVQLFLVICLFVGVLYAFVLANYWGTVPSGKSFNTSFPIPQPIFYVYCVFAFLLQGFAFELITKHPRRAEFEQGLMFFWGQFILSVLWLGLFFGLQAITFGLIEIFAAFICFIFAINTFRRIEKITAALMIPAWLLLGLSTFLNVYAFLIQ